MLCDNLFDVFDVAVTKIVQFTQSGKCTRTADQALSRDVQQGKDSCLSFVNHIPPKPCENQSACCAEVEYRCHPARQATGVGFNSKMADSRENVHVKVDQSRNHIFASDIHGPLRLGRRAEVQNRRDTATEHSDVTSLVQPSGGVDDVSVADQQIVHSVSFVIWRDSGFC